MILLELTLLSSDDHLNYFQKLKDISSFLVADCQSFIHVTTLQYLSSTNPTEVLRIKINFNN